MVQGGVFKPSMEEKEPTYDPIQNEAEKSGHRNQKGTAALARTSNSPSAIKQFFINHKDNGRLDWNEFREFGYLHYLF